MINNNSSFFKPWIGENYNKGINGKKTFILGASFYCNYDGLEGRKKCQYYKDCAELHNTMLYDTKCPFNNGSPLHDLPSTDFTQESKSHERFYELMKDFIGDENLNFDDYCDKVAFTNYVQHEVGSSTRTTKSDCKAEYLDMFINLLKNMKELPDIVIIWGCVVNVPIREANGELLGFRNTFTTKDYYLFKWKNFKGKDITFLSFYHPSSSLFSNKDEQKKMKEYLKKVFC